MKKEHKKDLTWMLWVLVLLGVGSLIGTIIKKEVQGAWYIYLNHSPLTPPNYMFSIIWTILYGIIAISGWIIWNKNSFSKLSLIKNLYIIQLILNWSWSWLFFRYHLITASLVCLLFINILVAKIIYLTYKKIKSVAFLMVPYLTWLLFAAYLNFYIWKNN